MIRRSLVVVTCSFLGSGCTARQPDAMTEERRSLLPPAPADYRVTEVGRAMAAVFWGTVEATEKTPDGREHPTRVRVTRHVLGPWLPGQSVACGWPTDSAPLFPAMYSGGPDRKNEALIVLDDCQRLLLWIETDDINGDYLLAALGTARVPSSRYSAEELDWAMMAIRLGRGPGGNRDPEQAPPGGFELGVRLGPGTGKVEYFHKLKSGWDGRHRIRRPVKCNYAGTPELELWRIGLWDLAPDAQGETAHLLLDCGESIDPTPLRQAMRGIEPTRRKVPIIGALVRIGDQEALKALDGLIREELAKGGRMEWSALSDAMQYGSPEWLPLVKKCPRAWLRLGGAAEELDLGGKADRIRPMSLARLGRIEALRFVKGQMQSRLRQEQADVGEDLLALAEITADLLPRQGDLVRAELDSFLLDALKAYPRMGLERAGILAIQALLGNQAALAELQQEDWSSADHGQILQQLAEIIRWLPEKQAGKLLAAMLVRTARGFPDDDFQDKEQTAIALTRILRATLNKQKAEAIAYLQASREDLDLLFGRLADDYRDWRSVRFQAERVASRRAPLTCALWALGDFPAVDELAIDPGTAKMYIERLGLSLEPKRDLYAAELPRLRQDVRRHWLALGLLRDEASVPALGDALRADAASDQNLPIEWALRRIGSAKAWPYFRDVERQLPADRRDYFFQKVAGDLAPTPEVIARLTKEMLRWDTKQGSTGSRERNSSVGAAQALLRILSRR